MTDYLGSRLVDWGKALSTGNAGRSGCYDLNAPSSMGGDQALITIHDRVDRIYRLARSSTDPDGYSVTRLDADEEYFESAVDTWFANTPGFGGTSLFVARGLLQAWGARLKRQATVDNGDLLLMVQGVDNTKATYTAFFAGLSYALRARTIRLNATTLLTPIHFADGGVDKCGVLKSTDDGLTWTKYGTLTSGDGFSLNEPAIAKLPNGNIWMVMRWENLAAAGKFYSSISTDGGQTWTTPTVLSTILLLTEGQHLYLVNDRGVIWKAGDWDAIGMGTDLAVYLLHTEYRPELTVQEASELGQRIIDAVAVVRTDVTLPAQVFVM